MTRKKVKLAYIENDSSRKTTLKKRKKGLIKKVKELSTLCGVPACAIIYSPNDPNPEVWPPTNSDVRNIISRFRAVPDTDRQKRMFNHEGFVRKSLDKATENVVKQSNQNKELEMTEVMFQCLYGNMEMPHLSYEGFTELRKVIARYLKDINRAMEVFLSSGVEIGQSSSAAAPVAPTSEGNMLMAAPTYEFGSSSSSAALFNPIHQQQQQFAYPPAPQVGVYYPQLQNLSLNHNPNQNQQQLFMAMMNHQEQMRYYHNSNQVQLQEQQHHHHHQITGESSSTVLDAANPSSSNRSNNPVTSSTNTNNIWFP